MYLPLFAVEASWAGDNVPSIVLAGSARPTNGIEKKAWIRGWREGAAGQCASRRPNDERSELKRGDSASLLVEGALSQRHTSEARLRGEAPVALPLEGALSPCDRAQRAEGGDSASLLVEGALSPCDRAQRAEGGDSASLLVEGALSPYNRAQR